MIDPNLIYIGALLNFIGAGIYIWHTIQGKTKPNRVTWFILSLAPLIAFGSMILQGVEFRQTVLSLVAGLGPLLIFLSTFVNKKSIWKIEKFDIWCGVLALVGLGMWLITREGDLAIAFSILADGLGFLPTLVKAFKYPETENHWPFSLGLINGAIALMIITKWDFTHAGFTIYIFLADITAFLLIRFKLGERVVGRRIARQGPEDVILDKGKENS